MTDERRTPPAAEPGKSRRTFLRGALLWAGLLGAGDALARCLKGVRTDEGPFYPPGSIPALNDLTTRTGRGRAKGRTLYLFGQVVGGDCLPVRDARIEIWQADDRGNYWHPQAAAQDELDPEFAYFAHALTGADGFYWFKTIVPSKYRFMSLERAPHVHFKVRREGFAELVTEMYFAGETDERLRAGDQVWKSRPEKTRAQLITPRESPARYASLGLEFETGAECCRFDLQLEPVRG